MAQVQDINTDGHAEENEMNSSEQNGGGSGGVIAPSTFVFGQNMESRVVKRQAEEQLDPETADKEDDKGEDPGEFPKASPNVMAQRPIIAPVSAFKDKPPQPDSGMETQSSEADKPAFKLAPATFATTRPTKTDEKVTIAPVVTQSSPAITAVLATPQEWQPTFGTASKSSGTPFKLKESALQAATEQVNGKGQNKKDQDNKGGSRSDGADGLSSPIMETNNGASSSSKISNENTDSNISSHSTEGSGDTPRNSYFIKLNHGDSRDVGFGVFGKFSDSQIGTVSFGKKEKEHDGATSENYFLQFANNGSDGSCQTVLSPRTTVAATSSSTSPPAAEKTCSSTGSPPAPLSLSGSGSSFVFGQHMNERVSSASKKEGELETAAEYVFGQNVSERVKSKETKDDSSEKSSSLFTSDGKTLAENANAYAEAKENSRLKFEEVPKLTGEEEEENVLQVQCKLYIFDVVKRSWQERGRGSLRLNDRRQSTTESAIQSRLVMRTQGSLRVILNTKLWSSMILEKASSKSLRISALDSDTKTPRVFLISATPKDAEQIYRAIEYRIQELKHEEQMKAEMAKEVGGARASTQEGEEETKQEASSKPENKEDEDNNETAEVPSSPKTDEDGALQSTDTNTQKDSEDTNKDSETKTEKETT